MVETHDRDALRGDEPGSALSLLREARHHKAATAALVVCIATGAVLCGLFLPESIAWPRRVAGGAIAGGLSWLLVMIGRLIDG